MDSKNADITTVKYDDGTGVIMVVFTVLMAALTVYFASHTLATHPVPFTVVCLLMVMVGIIAGMLQFMLVCLDKIALSKVIAWCSAMVCAFVAMP